MTMTHVLPVPENPMSI